ncbi:unnamed protein product [Blepharisma stoltei]|uniref:Uncharacterized protein n=1 Tax=Blepharisma stoltei TaxID=1481888 RepID=A0AAU9IE13_9CILI|nr:unnamed protein product [Blepharisma stoltei]
MGVNNSTMANHIKAQVNIRENLSGFTPAKFQTKRNAASFSSASDIFESQESTRLSENTTRSIHTTRQSFQNLKLPPRPESKLSDVRISLHTRPNSLRISKSNPGSAHTSPSATFRIDISEDLPISSIETFKFRPNNEKIKKRMSPVNFTYKLNTGQKKSQDEDSSDEEIPQELLKIEIPDHRGAVQDIFHNGNELHKVSKEFIKPPKVLSISKSDSKLKEEKKDLNSASKEQRNVRIRVSRGFSSDRNQKSPRLTTESPQPFMPRNEEPGNELRSSQKWIWKGAHGTLES